MGAKSRRKGAGGERELAKVLTYLLPGVVLKRGLGQARGGGQEVADVVGLSGYHIECKRGARCRVRPAMAQAVEDAAEGEHPIVMWRDDRGVWMTTERLVDRVKDLKQ